MSAQPLVTGGEAQYRPVRAVGDRYIGVHPGGRLCCFTSQPARQQAARGRPVVVVVHGAMREAAEHLAYAGDPRWDTVAPQFLAEVDVAGRAVPPDVLYWSVEGWKGGHPGREGVSSFAALDAVLLSLAGGGPITVFQHSGNGFLHRYAAVGRAPSLLGTPVRFIVANPSTFLWFGRDWWPYGLADPPPYARSLALAPRACLERYLSRDVWIVTGLRDNDPAAPLLVVDAPAMAQGATRRARAGNFETHLRQVAAGTGLPVSHRFLHLPGVGHSASGVFAAVKERGVILAGGRGAV